MNTIKFIKNSAKYIQNRINKAILKNKHQLTISGNYEIEKEIILPTQFTLILKDCHLRLKDGVFCNMFINNALAKGKDKLVDADKNIRIIGVGCVILDGGKHNGLNERNSKDFGVSTWKNRMLLFSNIDGFKISGLHIRNQRHWATSFMYCRNGSISNIDFLANDWAIYRDGKKDFTMDYATMWQVNAKNWENSDGIDINHGCHDILVENITGFTGDDTVAVNNCISAKGGFDREMTHVIDSSKDIYNVVIRNVNSSSWCSNVRLLCQGCAKMYNILVDGVFDSSLNSLHMTRGVYGVNIGDTRLYGDTQSTSDSVYNIVIKNVYSRAENAIRLAGGIKNLTVENVNLFDGAMIKVLDQTEEKCGKINIES